MLAGSALLVVALWFSRPYWTAWAGRRLVCIEETKRMDAILVDNLDQTYLPFERAAELRKAGLSAPVFVPTKLASDLKKLDMVSEGIVRVMANVAPLPEFEIIPIAEREPITLNAAYQVRDYLIQKQIKSLLLVVPGFRSQRSILVFRSVLGRAGVEVACVPVRGGTSPENWAHSLHGVQSFVEQILKLMYYRFYVLPFVLRADARSGALVAGVTPYGVLA